jgi:lysophospholipase L1-like esterase
MGSRMGGGHPVSDPRPMSEDPAVRIARHLRGYVPAGGGCRKAAYAALGDSFTAGTGCEPGERWPDRLADALRRECPRLVYRNLAQKGATISDVMDQAGAALQLEPDLVTVVCGANDVLESVRPDMEACAHRLAAIVDRLLNAMPGVLVVTATVPERWQFLGLRPRTQRRVLDGLQALNVSIRGMAAERPILLLDVAEHPGLDDAANFAPDGLHPSALGHARAAEEFERLLSRWRHAQEQKPRRPDER